MEPISSHPRSKMRVLILSAFVAFAAAAPAPQTPIIGVVPAFVVAPTIPPGDVEAAVINAQVKSLDQAQAAVDQARELTEIASENVNEGVLEANDLTKEKADLALWEAEEKKWQNLNAEQLAIAQQQAAAASLEVSAEPEIKAALPAEEPKPEEPKIEEAKTEEKIEQTAEIKSAEQSAEQPEIKSENIVETSVEIKPAAEIAPEVKATELKTLNLSDIKPKLLSPVVYAAPNLGFGYQPLITPVAYSQPAWNSYSAVTSFQNLQGQLLTQIH